MKFAAFPSCDMRLVAPNWAFAMIPIGFWRPVTNEIIAKRKKQIPIAKTLPFLAFFSIFISVMLI